MLIVLLHLSPVQAFLGSEVSKAVGEKLGTKVTVGSVNLGFLNRLIIDDVMAFDQQGDSMLYASRISAKVDYLPLFSGKVSISSAQLFGMDARLYKQDAKSKPNFQFVIDSLASKDTTSHTPLDLHIGSLIIRHGSLRYDQRDQAEKKGIFTPHHIALSGISSHIILERLTDDNINLLVKKIALKDKSGLQVENLHLKVDADKQRTRVSDFTLQLPHSTLSLGDIEASYRMENGSLNLSTLTYEGSINPSKITPSDLAPLLPILSRFNEALSLKARFSGTSTSLRCQELRLGTKSGNINLQASGRVSDWDQQARWLAHVENLTVTGEGVELISHNLGKNVEIPKEIMRLGTIHFKGDLEGKGTMASAKGNLRTDAGSMDFNARKDGKNIEAHVSTDGIQLNRLLDNKTLGTIAATIDARGTTDHLTAKGTISRFGFNNYDFKNITLDGSYNLGVVEGHAAINDPNVVFNVAGSYSTKDKKYAIDAHLAHLKPSILGMKVADKSYAINDVTINANNKGTDNYLDVESPFLNLHARGKYDLAKVYESVMNTVAEKLPTLPGVTLHQHEPCNDFTLQANITSTEILQKMFGIPLSINEPIHINGNVSDSGKDLNLYIKVPELTYGKTQFHDGNIELTTLGDSLCVDARTAMGNSYQRLPIMHLRATAANNNLSTLLHYDNRSDDLHIKGTLDANTQFAKSENGNTTVKVTVRPSEVMLGDTKWDVHPSDVTYEKNHLAIDNFAVSHDDQHVIINGKATPNKEDSIVADLKDVDVAYILGLVNFHSVEFAGKASGKAIVKSIFQDPDAYADLSVKDFTFENGPLGTLLTHASFDKEAGQINIHATADDGPGHQTYIDGYISPKRNYIDLGIVADGTSLKFMETYCGAFMDNIQAWAKGKVNLVGDLGEINLVGDVVAQGKLHMRQLGTDYTFDHLRAHAVPDDIQLLGDTIYDRERNTAIAYGGIHHKHLTRLSFDLDLKANNFLGYDTHSFGDNTFYGTIYATGDVGIHGKSGETVIDIDATPMPGSIFVYNAASPDAISDKSFIHWNDATPEWQLPFNASRHKENEEIDQPSDLRINFLINTNQNLTLKLMMDEQTGDYITLNGDGVIKANYFNKGGFDMFGNYIVDHGIYKLTVQNVIKKEFEFLQGGTIAFGGNPYNAPLNLQAKYIVNGVPLSDLSIGRSFSSNNIRVDCLMGITGTPGSPKVDFSMDLPTVNSDVKQMIYSVINSQEEMNQQVLYLLGVGRFYAQSKNNQADKDNTQSQASLAMQSILSGTISQQITNVLSGLVKNNNWNFGANISTGDDGFYNAEYEGILSGRMLNNRLLFNGQFGYRDNANSTQSFIGDFDLRYLIFPNGNLSVRVYNQSNDRYFTRNSLNTQGIGLIMKRDFNGWRDLFGKKKKKKVK